MSNTPQGGRVLRTATASAAKAAVALVLMAVFFVCFFLAPAVTTLTGLALVLIFEFLRRR